MSREGGGGKASELRRQMAPPVIRFTAAERASISLRELFNGFYEVSTNTIDLIPDGELDLVMNTLIHC